MRNDEATTPMRVVGPREGLILGSPENTDRFMLNAADTGGRLAIVEHVLAPGVLAAPMHRHAREDEYSYVLEGRLGAVFDGRDVFAEAGDFVFKPRGEWHTFWNAGDVPLRLLEIITPGGLEELFRLLGSAEEDPAAVLDDVEATFGCEIDLEQTGAVLERHGLRS